MFSEQGDDLTLRKPRNRTSFIFRMPNVRRTPIRTSQDSGRRPIRPIDREKMRPWLERILDNGAAPGVRWVDRRDKMFEIPWRHAARQGWSIDKDACIFELWASHTRKYIAGKDKEKDPKRWKANFRCALNSLPDVERVTGTVNKGSLAVRRYRFLAPEATKSKQCKGKKTKRKYKDESDEEEDFYIEENETSSLEGTPIKQEEEEETIPSPRVEGSIPNFAQLLNDSDVVSGPALSSTSHMSGCMVLHLTPVTPPSPPHRSTSPNSVESLSDSEVSHTDFSDEEAIECIFQMTEQEPESLLGYHPSLWTQDFMDFNDNTNVAQHVEIGDNNEMEVSSVITLLPQPEYWEHSSNSQ